MLFSCQSYIVCSYWYLYVYNYSCAYLSWRSALQHQNIDHIPLSLHYFLSTRDNPKINVNDILDGKWFATQAFCSASKCGSQYSMLHLLSTLKALGARCNSCMMWLLFWCWHTHTHLINTVDTILGLSRNVYHCITVTSLQFCYDTKCYLEYNHFVEIFLTFQSV